MTSDPCLDGIAPQQGARQQASASQAGLEWAQAQLQVVRVRGEIFGRDLVDEPGLQILLGLYVAQTLDGEMIGLSEAAAIIRSSPATARRWIAILQDHGLIEVQPDNDGSAFNLQLSTDGLAKVSRYINAMVAGTTIQPRSHNQ